MNTHDVIARYIDPKSDCFRAALMAAEEAIKETCPRVLFLTEAEVNESDVFDGLGKLSFERARSGSLQLWGVIDGNTVAIIVEDISGNVHNITPSYVRFIRH